MNETFNFNYPNNIQNEKFYSQNNNQTRASIQKINYAADEFKPKSKKLSNGKKLAIGIGITAAVIAGIYLVKSGKAKKALDSVKKFFSKNKTKTKDIAKEVRNTAQENVLSENSVKKIASTASQAEQKVETKITEVVQNSGTKIAPAEKISYEEMQDFVENVNQSNFAINRVAMQGKTKIGEITVTKDNIDKLCKPMDDFMTKVPESKCEITVQRMTAGHDMSGRKFINLQAYENAKIGDIVHPEPGYPYAAILQDGKNVLFGNSYYQTGGSVADIIVPKGSKILNHGGEVIFPRNPGFELLSKNTLDDGTLHVLLRYIQK